MAARVRLLGLYVIGRQLLPPLAAAMAPALVVLVDRVPELWDDGGAHQGVFGEDNRVVTDYVSAHFHVARVVGLDTVLARDEEREDGAVAPMRGSMTQRHVTEPAAHTGGRSTWQTMARSSSAARLPW